MSSQPGDIKKLVSIATDLELSPELRTKALEMFGSTGTREALLALLDIAANESLTRREREFALKCAKEIIKTTG